MSILQVIFIVLTVIALSAGQILFKLAAPNLVFTPSGLIGSLLNYKLLIALLVYFFATVMWLFVLKGTPLRIAYPFAALAFFVVPMLSHFLLGEPLNWNTFAGAAVIALGVWLSIYR
jgi:drug/metabolite transporter (DMT)-like permease